MPKIKTKSSAKKRFSLTGRGKVRYYGSYLRHNTFKRSQKMKRQNRGGQIMSASDARVVKKYFLAGAK